MAIVLDETSAFEATLNYALFAGAIFQLICIFAAIALPHSEEEKVDDIVSASSGNQSVASNRQSQDNASRRGKKEKKKHR